MKILLVLFAAVGLAASYGNTEVHHDVPSNAFVPETSVGSYQSSVYPQQIREYRRFGKDAIPSNSQAAVADTDFKESERSIRKLNTEVGELIADMDLMRSLPTSHSNELQKSVSQLQNRRTDPSLGYKPSSDFQMAFQRKENVEDQSSVLAVQTSHGFIQNQAPLSVQLHQSEIRVGEFRDSSVRRLPSVNDQTKFGEREEQHRNLFDFRSNKNQKSLEQRNSHQNDVRRNHDITQNRFFTEIPSFGSQYQLSSSHAVQETANQNQNTNQQNRKLSPSFPEGVFSSQGQAALDSKRTSGHTLQLNSFDQRTQLSTQDGFQRNQPERFLNGRLVANGNEQENAAIKDNSKVWNIGLNHQQAFAGVAKSDHQGLFQSTGKSQPILTASQVKQGHATSVLISGGHRASTLPIMVYSTENVASPHAIVLDKHSGIMNNKASVPQHLLTPYAQYTYTHPL